MSIQHAPVLRTRLSRRDLFGLAARSALSVAVSQSLIGCADPTTTDATAASLASSSCVLTAALTEGPYFVDEMLNRSDIRTDPSTGAVSAGVPLALTFNVSRVASSAC